MKTLFTSLLFFLTLSSNLYSGIDIDEIEEKLSMIQSTQNSGRDFWFTVPPSYQNKNGGEFDFVKILVTSTVDAKVTVSVGSKGIKNTKLLKANNVLTFILNPLQAQVILHSGITDKQQPAKVYENSAIHVESDMPILVYVAVKYYLSSDGFFALPSNTLGTTYINSAYNEPNIEQTEGWFNPFTGVVGVHDNTEVKFTMGGGESGEDAVPFEDGSLVRTGESKSTVISKGDVLLLSINGPKQDLSDSRFEGNKPFAIVSGVNCAFVPLEVYTCEYIVNMEFPVKYWGKDYFITPIFFRSYNGIIRIYASEDSTIIYRNGLYLNTINKGGGSTLGDGYLETRLWPIKDSVGKAIGPKNAHISANKPISVIYYNTGLGEEINNTISYFTDPFMMQIPAIEQSVNYSILYSPNEDLESNPYNDNFVVVTFPIVDDKFPDDLLFAELPKDGGEPIFKKLQDLSIYNSVKFESTYNGKTYASTNLFLDNFGTFIMKSDSTEFITYSFGFGYYDAYGFPSSFSLKDNSLQDSLPPFVAYTQQCNGDILLEDGIVIDLPLDVKSRSNISDIYLLESINYDFKWETGSGEFIPGISNELKWSMTVLDNSIPASALLYVVDGAGNDTTLLVEYNISKFQVNKTIIESTNRKFQKITFQDTIRNTSLTQPLNITRVEISNSTSKFKIESFGDNGWTPGIPIPPNEERYINISFHQEDIENLSTYKDSLFIGWGEGKNGKIEECNFSAFSELQININFPDYSLTSGNDFGDFDDKIKSKRLSDTIYNYFESTPIYVSSLKFKDGNKGFKIGGYTPIDWNKTIPIAPLDSVIIDILFSSFDIPQEEEDIIITDSLGMGISIMNENDELEEIEFAFFAEQKATIKAKKKETSVKNDIKLNEYITITNSEIKLLPKALLNGFTELSIYNLAGLNMMSIKTLDNANISLANLQSGTYIITLKSESKLLTRKMSITK